MTPNTILLGKTNVTEEGRPYIIAEVGVNHEGSFDLAKKLIELAHQGGANAVKFQTYKAETLASKNSPSYWDTSKEPTTSQYALFKKLDSFGDNEYRQLAEHCEIIGIDFVSTPFDGHAIDLLDPLMPFYKIASADLTNTPMLRHIASKGKPVVLSTGASTLNEIHTAIQELKKFGTNDIALLHCVLNYPCEYENVHLNMIKDMKVKFPEQIIGYSDHTVPDPAMAILTTAWNYGAAVIEKHFTHDKSLPGNDHYHAMDVDDLSKFTATIDLLVKAGGEKEKGFQPSEKISRLNARRSIVTKRNIEAGSILTEGDIINKRPGTGISPLHWDEVIGMKVKNSLDDDHILQWDDLQ